MFSIDKNKLFLGGAENFQDICFIYPLRMKEIFGLGEKKFEQYLGLLTLDAREVAKKMKEAGIDQSFTSFEYLLLSASLNDNFLLELQKAFFTFIKEEVHISIDTKEIFVGDIDKSKVLNEENFEDFQMVLRAQNCLPIPEPIPKNENAMQRKFRLRREQVAEAKRRAAAKSDGMALDDALTKLICFNVGITFDNVGNLTYYQFRKLFTCAQAKYKYDLDLRMIAAGADPKKIKPKSWLEKLDI